MSINNWFKVNDESKILTPGLIVFPERIEHNIKSMISISGDVNRLIPHVKTYKMPSVVKLQMDYGIKEFKCATFGELEMLISCKVKHILLAIQPTKEKAIRFLNLQKKYPKIKFSTLVDNIDSLKLFSSLSKATDIRMNLWLDINNGMNRTGIIPDKALGLCLELFEDQNLKFNGLHVYDGHIRHSSLSKRLNQCNLDFEKVEQLVAQIKNKMGKLPQIITGGTPSFYPHSLRKKNLLSPGTTLLWDLGYQKIWKESPFLYAAVLVTRLISKPAPNIYCFDLGHKAVSSEMPLPRMEIFGLEEALHKSQSEEHLIVEYKRHKNLNIGDLFYAIPYHICPTVAKYNKSYVVINGEIQSSWDIQARDYQLSI